VKTPPPAAVRLSPAARFIWLRGLHREKNIQAGFRCDIVLRRVPSDAVLRVTAASLYRAYVNGRFVSHGPAKAPHGYARVDEIPIGSWLTPGRNRLAIEVAGYNDRDYYLTDEPSFLLADVAAAGRTLAATGTSWRALRLPRRQKVEMHGWQRPFSEIWDVDATWLTWRTAPLAGLPFTRPEVLDFFRRLLPRGVPLPSFAVSGPAQLVSVGTMEPDAGRPITPLRHREGMYPDDEVPEKPSLECARERPGPFRGRLDGLHGFLRGTPLRITQAGGDTTLFFDTGVLRASFAGLDIELPRPATVDLVHVEQMTEDGELDPRRDACVQVTRLHAPPGRTRFEQFEVASTRYLRVIVRGVREFALHAVTFREYAHPPMGGGSFLCSDGVLNRIYEAAGHTLRLNMLDEFYDCPSRERAGWLCDSFFSARAAFYLFGDTAVDRLMLEDFLLPAAFPGLPPGMVPMCYPAGRLGHIPNWAMFFILQLGEHLERTGDAAFIARFRERVEQLIACLDTFRNAEGLLEKLTGWVFVDWSAANEADHVQPVSTATNALFACALDVAGRLFDRADWTARAKRIRAVLREKALLPQGSALFSDSLHRDEKGMLCPTGKASEACQYYVLWTGVVSPEAAPRLVTALLEEFGPAPERPPGWIHVARANLLVGQTLRLDLLARWGETERLLKEMRALYPPMMDAGPGTLWENLGPSASVCHGFASHAAVWLKRDVLGLSEVSVREKRVVLAPYPGDLKWAAGSLDVPEGVVSLSWSVEHDRFRLVVSVPPGYAVSLAPPAIVRLAGRVTVNGREVDATRRRLERLPRRFTLLADR
jgi:alpha-L-rhamnosidase